MGPCGTLGPALPSHHHHHPIARPLSPQSSSPSDDYFYDCALIIRLLSVHSLQSLEHSHGKFDDLPSHKSSIFPIYRWSSQPQKLHFSCDFPGGSSPKSPGTAPWKHFAFFFAGPTLGRISLKWRCFHGQGDNPKSCFKKGHSQSKRHDLLSPFMDTSKSGDGMLHVAQKFDWWF